eukprot:1149969-Pelagomonas_calceolata.AAC.6
MLLSEQTESTASSVSGSLVLNCWLLAADSNCRCFLQFQHSGSSQPLISIPGASGKSSSVHWHQATDSNSWCLQQFHAQRGRPRGDLLALAHDMGLAQSVLNQQWSELSGAPQVWRQKVGRIPELGPREGAPWLT